MINKLSRTFFILLFSISSYCANAQADKVEKYVSTGISTKNLAEQAPESANILDSDLWSVYKQHLSPKEFRMDLANKWHNMPPSGIKTSNFLVGEVAQNFNPEINVSWMMSNNISPNRLNIVQGFNKEKLSANNNPLYLTELIYPASPLYPAGSMLPPTNQRGLDSESVIQDWNMWSNILNLRF
jgi:hypothetical protein